MPLDPDAIVDRRRMRRKLTFWRVGAVAIAIIAIVGFAWRSLPSAGLSPSGDYIARIKVQGLIRNNQERVEALERLANSPARAVIVRVDTPGGTTAGSEQLYDALRRLQEKKPMVVVVDGLAASGGYIARYGGRSHHCAGYVHHRFDRRAVSVPQFQRHPEDGGDPGRSRSGRRR